MEWKLGDFICLCDTMSACGCEASLTARRRFGCVKFMECSQLLCEKNFYKAQMDYSEEL